MKKSHIFVFGLIFATSTAFADGPNTQFLKDGIMRLTQSIQNATPYSSASDADLQTAQNLLLQAESLVIGHVAPSACATIFDGKGFTGRAINIMPGMNGWLWNFKSIETPDGWIDFNDVAKSVAVRNGCSITLWENKDFGGRDQTYTGSTPDFGPVYSNLYSSAKCDCGN